ncbi:uncharacterized protein isoform X2 [Rhodnius prolixus]|uniref:uncharacterized protein isoform X2 n=1 Tax=Rhodnius prolixus TaxID=13249 RepID=UPI003D18D165
MDESFNSFILEFRNAIGDHNYNTSVANSPREEVTTSSDVDESDYKDFTVNRSTGSCTNSKSSVAIIYPCYLCNYETYRSTSLVAHLRQHTQGNLTLETERFQIGKFMCSTCDFKTRWLSSLKEHEEKVHFNSNSNSNNVENNNNHNKGGPFICKNCGYLAEKLDAIGTHMSCHFTSTNVFGNIVPSFPCCLCEFVSRQLDELQTHFSKMHSIGQQSDKKLTVSVASTGCIINNYEPNGNSNEMISHIKKEEEEDLLEYPCDYCNHRSPSIHLWRDHMEAHGGVLEISLGSMEH